MTEHTYFYHTEPSLVYDRNDGENLADFRWSQFYINNTNDDVTVVLSNNLPVFIPRSSGGYNSSTNFTIRNIYQFNSNSKIVDTINAIQQYRKHYENKQEELEIIAETLIKSFNANRDIRIASVVIDRIVDIGIIKEQKAVYIPEANVLLQHGQLNLSCPHPFSIEGQAMAEYKDFIKNKKISGIFIELVDNENNITNKYMYVAKSIIELPVRKDKNRPSGVYYTKAIYDRLDEVHLSPEYYSFDDAEKSLGLHKTKEEAISGGNPEQLLKLDYQKKENEAAEAKHQLELMKHEVKTNELTRAEEIAKLKHSQETELAQFKEKMISLENDLEVKRRNNAALKEEIDETKARRADYYESRSYERKESSDLVKFAPALVIAAIGAFAYWGKSK